MTTDSKIEGRRSFLKMLGLAPVVGAAALTEAAAAAASPAKSATFRDWRGFEFVVADTMQGDRPAMAVRWSDPSTGEWEMKVFNEAGSYVLPGHARQASIYADGNNVVVETPADKWVLTYIGKPFVWSCARSAG